MNIAMEIKALGFLRWMNSKICINNPLTLMRIIMRIPIPKVKGLREGGLINQGSTPRVGSGVRRCWVLGSGGLVLQ